MSEECVVEQLSVKKFTIVNVTRTHSMARHRKSPRSRRNLMVIDPLTPSQGHQFDRRLKFFSVSWSTAHMPHDHVQKIKFLTPPHGPRGWGPKDCAGACAIHVSNSHTISSLISEKIF